MSKVKVQFSITVFNLKFRKKLGHEIHLKIAYIYKDKAQVISFKKVIPHIMF